MVGGGPVGVVMALCLAEAGVDVAVWEQRSELPSGTRAIGVHPPSLALFEQLGVLPAVLEHAVRIDRGEAWNGRRRLGTVVFEDRPVAHPFVAAIEQWRTERVLRDRLEAILPGSLVGGTRCRSIEQDPDGLRVSGVSEAGPVSTTASMLVVASGGRSAIDDPAASGRTHRYPDRYVMGDVRDQSGAGAVARVHLHHRGVVESFPLPEGRRRYVVHTGFDSARQEPTASGFAELVTARTGDVVDPTSNSMLSAFGVRRRRRATLVAGRVVHIGDAAHEISPIGGQGMNLGWSDAHAFAPAIVQSVHQGSPDAARLASISRRQLAAARRAGVQAAANMVLGRPLSPVIASVRDLALRAALNSPAMPVLADAYTMRWLR